MTRHKLIILATVLLVVAARAGFVLHAQEPVGATTFKAKVELVRVSAIVRDRKGRFISNLSARDFEVLDGGESRRISDFQQDYPAVSVALLIDVSGSMEAQMDSARQAATFMLEGLDRQRDEVGIFTFDTHLDEIQPFAAGVQALPRTLSMIKPFGATSLRDAIAATARRLTNREGLRRAVIVFTDGSDNWSRLTPAEASAVASAIDVPVYIVGLVPLIDNPASDISTVTAERSLQTGTLANLASWTGGRSFVVSASADRRAIARVILDELRHQYVIAFESSSQPGWHSLVVRTRDKDLVVRARSGYDVGQSRPIS